MAITNLTTGYTRGCEDYENHINKIVFKYKDSTCQQEFNNTDCVIKMKDGQLIICSSSRDAHERMAFLRANEPSIIQIDESPDMDIEINLIEVNDEDIGKVCLSIFFNYI